MAFIPLVSLGRVIGKFMLYYDEPHALSTNELQLVSLIAWQVAFAVERTRAEAQARRSEAAAEEASRLKDEFLATLSHELRTPLNAISAGCRCSRQAWCLGTASSRDRCHRRNTNLQARLIEDILDVSRIISGKLEIEHAPVLIAPLIDTVVSGRCRPRRARTRVSQNLSGRSPVIDGDAKRLHQVLGNVLSNAVKFTPGGGRIDVRCAYQDDAIVIEVQDFRRRHRARVPALCLRSLSGRRTAARFAVTAASDSDSRSPATDRATRRRDSRDERRARAGHHGAHSTAGVGRRI
jgi:signal transduction histidine kinase